MAAACCLKPEITPRLECKSVQSNVFSVNNIFETQRTEKKNPDLSRDRQGRGNYTPYLNIFFLH